MLKLGWEKIETISVTGARSSYGLRLSRWIASRLFRSLSWQRKSPAFQRSAVPHTYRDGVVGSFEGGLH